MATPKTMKPINPKAQLLVERMECTTPDGTDFELIISETMRLYMLGELTLEDTKSIYKAADQQLRKFGRAIAVEERQLKATIAEGRL